MFKGFGGLTKIVSPNLISFNKSIAETGGATKPNKKIKLPKKGVRPQAIRGPKGIY